MGMIRMKLSIIIPTREEEKAIGLTVEHLHKDLSVAHEIIVSDGGSTDATVEVAQRAGARVVVFDKKRPHNASIGRNESTSRLTP